MTHAGLYEPFKWKRRTEKKPSLCGWTGHNWWMCNWWWGVTRRQCLVLRGHKPRQFGKHWTTGDLKLKFCGQSQLDCWSAVQQSLWLLPPSYAALSLWCESRILRQENLEKKKKEHPECSANIPWKINKEIQSEEGKACLYSCNLITALNHCNISDQCFTQNHIHQRLFVIMVHNVTIIRSLAHVGCGGGNPVTMQGAAGAARRGRSLSSASHVGCSQQTRASIINDQTQQPITGRILMSSL